MHFHPRPIKSFSLGPQDETRAYIVRNRILTRYILITGSSVSIAEEPQNNLKHR
jgi:hypothetical protein